MSTLADYANRTYDVLAFQGQQPAGDVRLDPTILDQGGLICTGAQKLAQRFVLEFLTEAGSMPYAPTRGTAFMTRLHQGYLRTETDVLQAFTAAVTDILNNFHDDNLPGDPSDEQLAAADLTSLSIAPGSLTMYVTLTTAAGSSRPVIMPLATVI